MIPDPTRLTEIQAEAAKYRRSEEDSDKRFLLDEIPFLLAEVARLRAERDDKEIDRASWRRVAERLQRELIAAEAARDEALQQFRAISADLMQRTAQRDEYKALASVGTWHDGCRPNRQKAAEEIAKSQSIIDTLADRISHLEQQLRDTEAQLIGVRDESERRFQMWATELARAEAFRAAPEALK